MAAKTKDTDAAPTETKKAKSKKAIEETPVEVELDHDDALALTKIPNVDEALLLSVKCAPINIAEVPVSKKASKSSFIFEINEAEERLNKKKYTEIKPTETLTRAIRSSDRRGEETQEEMEARIARLLQEEDRTAYDPDRVQICTKCGLFPVSEMYVIDRNLGFCDECAILLRLGETKEAKTFEFGLGNHEEAEEDAAY